MSKRAAMMLLGVNGIGSLCITANCLGIKPESAQTISRYTLGLFMIAAGGAHFDPKLMNFYLTMMPPMLPYKWELIYISGVVECLGGFLSLIPSTKDFGGHLIIATLVGVFPANIYTAMSSEVQRSMGITRMQALSRLPLQAIMIGMAWIYLRRNQTTMKSD